MARNFKEIKTELKRNGRGVVVMLKGCLAQAISNMIEYGIMCFYWLLLCILLLLLWFMVVLSMNIA